MAGTDHQLPQTSNRSGNGKRSLSRQTKSESSFQCGYSTLCAQSKRMRRSSSEQRSAQASWPTTTTDDSSTCNPSDSSSSSSISSIGTAHLTHTESQDSGYTTESSYQTATDSSFSLGTGSPLPAVDGAQFLHEIHVSIDSNAAEATVETISNDLSSLLSNEVEHIVLSSAGQRSAIYLIAYRFM
ncbi:uncharacterized protein LOC108594400 [Drosophila busckii]|uniref:uncharacterized protein LOC108594400 n=1 Tax=Drosophila busckii TaxID=30019 RepID=UPI00083EE9B5|nr:uncharacterized protein LOC108594400 [Drosophila busckii]